MQLRRLAALERQKIIDEAESLESEIADFQRLLTSPERQRTIVSEELAEIVAKFGDERRTQILLGFDGDMSVEDLIPEEEMVVTVTRGGYVKRTRSDNYRSQHRGGKGVKGAQLRADDVVEHFFVTTTHHWLLFFTNMGRVYRAKAYEIQEAGRDAKGQHVANLLEMQPDEQIAEILDIRDYEVATYLVLATRDGLVKKTALHEYDTNRTRGIIAIKLREGDELVSAMLVDERRRDPARLEEGHVAALRGHRRGAASHGPLHLGRHRHALPRRRLPARGIRRSRGRAAAPKRPANQLAQTTPEDGSSSSSSPKADLPSAPPSTSTACRTAADSASRSRS